MKKEGFTLVELLAVIAILAILVVIALPNIINMFNKSKEKMFISDCQTLYKAAESYILNESLKNPTEAVNAEFDNAECGNEAIERFNTTLSYHLEIVSGNIVGITAKNKEFYIELTGNPIKLEDAKVEKIEKLEEQTICE